MTQAIQKFDLDLLDLSETRANVFHEWSRRQPFNGAGGDSAQLGATLSGRFLHQRLSQRMGARCIADECATLDLAYHDRRHGLPECRVMLDTKQIAQEIEVEILQGRLGDGRHPGVDALWRIVGDALYLECLRARGGQLLVVLVGHERRIRVRPQHVGCALPKLLEAFFLATVALPRRLMRKLEHASFALRFGDEHLEGVRETFGCALFGRDRPCHEGGDRLIAHALHQVVGHLRIVGIR